MPVKKLGTSSRILTSLYNPLGLEHIIPLLGTNFNMEIMSQSYQIS